VNVCWLVHGEHRKFLLKSWDEAMAALRRVAALSSTKTPSESIDNVCVNIVKNRREGR